MGYQSVAGPNTVIYTYGQFRVISHLPTSCMYFGEVTMLLPLLTHKKRDVFQQVTGNLLFILDNIINVSPGSSMQIINHNVAMI